MKHTILVILLAFCTACGDPSIFGNPVNPDQNPNGNSDLNDPNFSVQNQPTYYVIDKEKKEIHYLPLARVQTQIQITRTSSESWAQFNVQVDFIDQAKISDFFQRLFPNHTLLRLTPRGPSILAFEIPHINQFKNVPWHYETQNGAYATLILELNRDQTERLILAYQNNEPLVSFPTPQVSVYLLGQWRTVEFTPEHTTQVQ